MSDFKLKSSAWFHIISLFQASQIFISTSIFLSTIFYFRYVDTIRSVIYLLFLFINLIDCGPVQKYLTILIASVLILDSIGNDNTRILRDLVNQ